MPHTKKTYWERRNKGLCCWCNTPAIPGRVKCEEHTAQHSKWDRQSMNKRRTEKRCIACGSDLLPDVDTGHVKCINCREHLNTWR